MHSLQLAAHVPELPGELGHPHTVGSPGKSTLVGSRRDGQCVGKSSRQVRGEAEEGMHLCAVGSMLSCKPVAFQVVVTYLLPPQAHTAGDTPPEGAADHACYLCAWLCPVCCSTGLWGRADNSCDGNALADSIQYMLCGIFLRFARIHPSKFFSCTAHKAPNPQILCCTEHAGTVCCLLPFFHQSCSTVSHVMHRMWRQQMQGSSPASPIAAGKSAASAT
jgi:hypothetical protein